MKSQTPTTTLTSITNSGKNSNSNIATLKTTTRRIRWPAATLA